MIKPVELTNIEGTVITANAYKDADAIITILSEGRKLTFKACGAMKPTSKLHLATYIYSDVVLEIGGYKDHPEIKGVKLKKNRTDIYEDLKFMTALGIVQEIITNLVTEEDFIDDKFIEALLSFPKILQQQILFLPILLYFLKYFKISVFLTKDLSAHAVEIL